MPVEKGAQLRSGDTHATWVRVRGRVRVRAQCGEFWSDCGGEETECAWFTLLWPQLVTASASQTETRVVALPPLVATQVSNLRLRSHAGVGSELFDLSPELV